MNALNNLPYMPTEIWDKIFDIKYSLEAKEEHNLKNKTVLDEFNKFKNKIIDNDMTYSLKSKTVVRKYQILHRNNGRHIRILKPGFNIDLSLFSRSIIRFIEAEKLKYDDLSITDDDSDDDYLYD